MHAGGVEAQNQIGHLLGVNSLTDFKFRLASAPQSKPSVLAEF
ncbi:MAG: hypothetical protein ACI9G5_003094 [Paracoccaceae bacterium]|jgi:hypothetical protein